MEKLYMRSGNQEVLAFLEILDEEARKTNPSADRVGFYSRARNTQRRGQAFMNALRGSEYYDQLTGTLWDPFYRDDDLSLLQAIDFLTTKR